jgi:N-formylglutamate amidohydrolase
VKRRAACAAIVSSLVVGLFCGVPQAADVGPVDLVLVRQGTLPIILTAPHGGRDAIPGIEPRKDRQQVGAYRQWGGFNKGGDLETDVLAEAIAAEIVKLTGEEPYLVVAKFQRKYVDANRPSELGLDDRKARPFYDQYHQSIRRFVDEVRKNHRHGLLIDVHGQSKDRDVLMRGTINGRSVDRLLRRAGVDGVTGPNGVYGQLEANGFKIFPGNDVAPSGHSEDAGFNGGYTLDLYGSHHRNGIDAVQMEFGAKYRQKSTLDASARDAARAIAAFYAAYLKSPAR